MSGYYTYVLIAKNGKRTYAGSTRDMQRRISEHNQGKVSFSKKYKPFELLVCEEFDTLTEARQREIFYKSTTVRRKLAEVVDRWKNKKEKIPQG